VFGNRQVIRRSNGGIIKIILMNMENKENIQQLVLDKNKWYAPYIVAGLIFGVGSAFAKTLIGGEFILTIVAMGTGFFYYPLKSKIKIKNRIARIITTFLILEIIAGLLVGVLAGLTNGLVNRSSSNTEYQKKIVDCQSLCDFHPTTNVWGYIYMKGEKSGPLYEKYGAIKTTPTTKYFQTQEQCLNYCLTL